MGSLSFCILDVFEGNANISVAIKWDSTVHLTTPIWTIVVIVGIVAIGCSTEWIRSCLTLLRVASEVLIFLMSLLNLSSSCSSTTVVGVMLTPKFLRMTSMSYSLGSLPRMSLATLSMKSSRLMPPPVSPAISYDYSLIGII